MEDCAVWASMRPLEEEPLYVSLKNTVLNATSSLLLCRVGRELAFSISKQKHYCAFFRIHLNKYLSYSWFCYAVPILLRSFSTFMSNPENNNRHGNLGKQKACGSNDWQIGLFHKNRISKVCFCQRHKNLTAVLFISSHTHHTFLKAVSTTCYVLWHLSLFNI